MLRISCHRMRWSCSSDGLIRPRITATNRSHETARASASRGHDKWTRRLAINYLPSDRSFQSRRNQVLTIIILVTYFYTGLVPVRPIGEPKDRTRDRRGCTSNYNLQSLQSSNHYKSIRLSELEANILQHYGLLYNSSSPPLLFRQLPPWQTISRATEERQERRKRIVLIIRSLTQAFCLTSRMIYRTILQSTSYQIAPRKDNQIILLYILIINH
jgi:hypothetical protein